jgi:hypothetical protein
MYMALNMNENDFEPHGKAKINEIFNNMFYANCTKPGELVVMHMCVRVVNVSSVSTILRKDFETVLTV